jgi:hypothetical protein
MLDTNPLFWPLYDFNNYQIPSEHRDTFDAKLRELQAQAPFNFDSYNGVVFGWRGLAELVDRYEEKEWIFRGQTESWPLLPAIGRPGARKTRGGENLDHDLGEEARAMSGFRDRSFPFLQRTPENKLEWLALARHHGMATRLLDWTESFLVSAMFACMSSGISHGKAKHAELYAIRDIHEPLITIDPFQIEEVCLYRPPYITPRIPAQQSVFTVHPRPQEPLDHHPKLERWLIASDACFYIKKKLDLCGINESTMIPDLDGLGRYQSWRYKWNI